MRILHWIEQIAPTIMTPNIMIIRQHTEGAIDAWRPMRCSDTTARSGDRK
jgi:hypothetical protein